MAPKKKGTKKAGKKTLKAGSSKKAGARNKKKTSTKLQRVSSRKNAPPEPSKECLSREDLIKIIRSELLKQKQLLLGEAGATLNNMPAAVLYPDLGDQAGMEIERNFLLRLRGREQKLLKKIDDALDRIENGTFGLCEVCGREIDIKRLMARPVTTMCIECKIEQEEEEKLREV